jgi:hypothetical protein
MTKSMRIALVLSAATALSACASVTRGTKQTFYIMSEPSGGAVTTSSGQNCVTPCKLKLSRKTEFTADIALAGYKPGSVHVESKVGAGGIGGTAGNILLGGIIGIAVDGASGAMQDLTPNPLKWAMAAEGSSDETKVVPAARPKATPRRAPTRTGTRTRKQAAISAPQPSLAVLTPVASTPAAASPAAASPVAAMPTTPPAAAATTAGVPGS